METFFTILFLVSGTIGTFYFFKAIFSLFKRNGKAKSSWKKFGIFGLILPFIFVIGIGFTADPSELDLAQQTTAEAKQQEVKEDPEAIQISREEVFALLATHTIDNPVFLEQYGYFHKISGDEYEFSHEISFKDYNEKYDAASKSLFKRKDLFDVFDKYGLVEATISGTPMFPTLTGKATEFAVPEDYGIGIYAKAYWEDGLLFNDKDNYYLLEFERLEKKDNEKLENILDAAVGSSAGGKAMKWYTEMQEMLYSPMYYHRHDNDYLYVSTGYFSKRIKGYTFVMNAEFDPSSAETFEDAFTYTLDIYDESFTDFIKDSSKVLGNLYGEVKFSKENEDKLLKKAADYKAGISEEAKEDAEALAATQSEPSFNESATVDDTVDEETTSEDVEYEEVLVRDAIDLYLYSYVNLETEYLYNSVDAMSTFYDEQEAYMQSLKDRGISLQLNHYDIVSINHLPNGDAQATVNESFTIYNPASGEKTVDQTAVYSLILADGLYYINKLDIQ